MPWLFKKKIRDFWMKIKYYPAYAYLKRPILLKKQKKNSSLFFSYQYRQNIYTLLIAFITTAYWILSLSHSLSSLSHSSFKEPQTIIIWERKMSMRMNVRREKKNKTKQKIVCRNVTCQPIFLICQILFDIIVQLPYRTIIDRFWSQ